MRSSLIGAEIERVDGPLKVSGAAPYVADRRFPDLAHALCVGSPVARGRLSLLDTAAAERTPGVVAVLTHRNRPPIGRAGDAVEAVLALDGEEIHYAGQVVAVIVAESREAAREAAGRIRIAVKPTPDPLRLDVESELGSAFPPRKGSPGLQGTRLEKGVASVEAALEAAEVRIAATYRTPIEHHNPLEPHTTLAIWDGDRLTLHETTQQVQATQASIAQTFGLPRENVTILCPFLGGGFGCKGAFWMHIVLAALAARVVARPVLLELTRTQMFELVGYRPVTRHELALGAKRDGTLVAVRHRHVNSSSPIGEYVEPSAGTSRMLYASPNCEWEHKLVDLDLGAPIWNRGPGDTPGTYALESAMDELADALEMDPIALRRKNHSRRDPESGRPYSAKHLLECYRLGAERFGWSQRPPQAGTLREGTWRIGMGMASAVFPGFRERSAARACLFADGSAEILSATHDLGTGMYTLMAQVAAETLGLPIGKVTARLGNSSFPEAPAAGGSQSTASVLPAVQAACSRLLNELACLAILDPASPLYRLPPSEVEFSAGRLIARNDPEQSESLAALCARQERVSVEATAASEPSESRKKWEFSSFGAHFVEVGVDEWTCEVRVRRVVSVLDIGRVINRKTARSQVLGGVIWGIGMALTEESRVDRHSGRYVTANLADYRVPVNADVPEIEVHFIDEPDLELNPLGARGLGEVGMTGVAAAIANAVHHATGRRVRDLPITPEKLL